MYVFLHNGYQLYDVKIKWSSARGKNSLRNSVTSFILMLVQIIQQSGVKTRKKTITTCRYQGSPLFYRNVLKVWWKKLN